MISRRTFLGGIGVLALIPTGLVLQGCASDAKAQEGPLTVHLGEQSVYGGIVFSYAKEVGILDDVLKGSDVSVDIADFNGGPAMNEAFASGQLDFALMGNLPAFTGVASDYGYTIVATAQRSDKWGAIVAARQAGVSSLDELPGKRIGTVIGGSWHYAAGLFLKKAGLEFPDVQLVNTASETASSIRSGAIDAGMVSEAVAYQLVADGSAVLLDDAPGEPTFQAVCASEGLVSQHPDVTALLIKTVDATLRYQDEHLEDYLAFYQEKTGADPEPVRATWELQERAAKIPAATEDEASENMLQWMKDNGITANTAIQPDELFDLGPAQDAGLAASA